MRRAGGSSCGCSAQYRSGFLAALVVAQGRRIGARTQHVAHMVRRMAEGDVEACPVDPADRDELVEIQSALNEMATRVATHPVLCATGCGALALCAAVPQMCDGWSVRMGIHVGPVTAGLLGRKRLQYDVWGDTVDLAALLHHHDRPGAIMLSDAARFAVARYGESGRLDPWRWAPPSMRYSAWPAGKTPPKPGLLSPRCTPEREYGGTPL